MNGYRLFAREVIPHFKGQLAAPRTSHDWATAKRGELFGRAGQAIINAITRPRRGEGSRRPRRSGADARRSRREA